MNDFVGTRVGHHMYGRDRHVAVDDTITGEERIHSRDLFLAGIKGRPWIACAPGIEIGPPHGIKSWHASDAPAETQHCILLHFSDGPNRRAVRQPPGKNEEHVLGKSFDVLDPHPEGHLLVSRRGRNIGSHRRDAQRRQNRGGNDAVANHTGARFSFRHRLMVLRSPLSAEGLDHGSGHFDYPCLHGRHSREGGNPVNSVSSAISGPPPPAFAGAGTRG